MEEEEFGFTNSIYQSFFQTTFQWPCLSFDIIKDNLGAIRTDFPLTAFFVTATQAGEDDDNTMMVLKVENLQCTKNDDNLLEEDIVDDPTVNICQSTHRGCANRVRSMPQNPHIVATWSDIAGLSVFNISSNIRNLSLEVEGGVSEEIVSIELEEGYGLAWSPHVEGLLAFGNNAGELGIIKVYETGYVGLVLGFVAHKESIEDIVFSPNDVNVFATCSSDHHIKMWTVDLSCLDQIDPNNLVDSVKSGVQLVFSWEAHNCDVNVIDWNKIDQQYIVSGGDDGTIKVWDISNMMSSLDGTEVKDPEQFVVFTSGDYHKEPITSVEWNPNDSSEFAAACEEGRVTIWDLSVEAMDDEKIEGIPEQLLFEHIIEEPKELHFHPQIPSLLAVTGSSSFDVFIPDIEQGDL